MNWRQILIWLMIALTIIGIAILVVYKYYKESAIDAISKYWLLSKPTVIVLGIILLLGIIVYLIYKNKMGNGFKIEHVQADDIIDVITKRLILEFKIPSYFDDEGDIQPANPSHIRLGDRKPFTHPATDSKFLLIEVFILSPVRSGIHLLEIPRSEGIETVEKGTYTLLHNTNLQEYAENKLWRRKFPIHSFEDKTQRYMQQYAEYVDDPEELSKLAKEQVQRAQAQGNNPLHGQEHVIEMQPEIKMPKRSKAKKKQQQSQGYTDDYMEM